MDYNWREQTKDGETRLTSKVDGYTLIVSAFKKENENLPTCSWTIGTPKAPFNLCSKRPIFDIDRCRMQCEQVFSQLMDN